MIGLEQPQTLFNGAADHLGTAIDTALAAIDKDTCFRREKELLAPLFQGVADQRLVLALAIDPRGIEVVVANVETWWSSFAPSSGEGGMP